MNRRVATILPFLIITLLCVTGVELFYRMVERRLSLPDRQEMAGVADVVERRPVAQSTGGRRNYSIILDRNLFDALLDIPVKKKEGVREEPLEKLEASTLDAVLLGTVTGITGGTKAIIYDKSKKKQDIYSVGDSVQDAVIKRIIRGKVILSYNGKDEVLDMSDSKEYKPPPVAHTPSVRRQRVTPIQVAPVKRKIAPVRAEIVRPKRNIRSLPKKPDTLDELVDNDENSEADEENDNNDKGND